MTDLTGERPARLSVGVVGTGRVGCALARALHDAGHRVVAAQRILHQEIVDREYERIERAEESPVVTLGEVVMD